MTCTVQEEKTERYLNYVFSTGNLLLTRMLVKFLSERLTYTDLKHQPGSRSHCKSIPSSFDKSNGEDPLHEVCTLCPLTESSSDHHQGNPPLQGGGQRRNSGVLTKSRGAEFSAETTPFLHREKGTSKVLARPWQM